MYTFVPLFLLYSVFGEHLSYIANKLCKLWNLIIIQYTAICSVQYTIYTIHNARKLWFHVVIFIMMVTHYTLAIILLNIDEKWTSVINGFVKILHPNELICILQLLSAFVMLQSIKHKMQKCTLYIIHNIHCMCASHKINRIFFR